MEEMKKEEKEMDDEIKKRAFDQAMNIWINPEIEIRKKKLNAFIVKLNFLFQIIEKIQQNIAHIIVIGKQ